MRCLLFCQDEKSARVLMPLVQGLDIDVMHETEVFSAMRTLMAERFDFLIIDYEDEHTGRILLKNARGSTRNKAALAIAVVDPETGANALRLGADFLVTRPINLGQAEGVLRLVRSSVLRRKVSSADSATTETAAEAMHLPQEATASPQQTTTAMADELMTANSNLTESFVSSSVETSVGGFSDGRATLSSDAVEAEGENTKIALDAMIAESEQTVDGQDRDLQPTNESLVVGEVRIALASPPPHPASLEAADAFEATLSTNVPPEQSNISSRDVPTAVSKVEKRPAKLFLVSMAALVIVLVMAAIGWHIRTANSWAKADAPVQSSADSPASAKTNTTESAPAPVAAEPQTQEPTKQAPGALAIVPGQSSIHSTPQGTRTRTTKVATGNQLPVRADLTPLTATVSLNSDPANAAVWMDGKDTGRMTPAQISIEKPGTHTFVFKKQGYLDEAATANLRIGQTFDMSPSLRALGQTDEIKMVGTFSKIFGRGEGAGQGIVSVKTQPKGAQIAVNSRTINKPSPAKFYLNPGNYMVDITIAGFKSIHRVVSVDKGGKIIIDEVMERE
jgi:hypothetical protein